MLSPTWIPKQSDIAETNIAKALNHLQLPDYKALHRWSLENYQGFWRYIIKQLGIVFKQLPETICELSAGITKPNWLPGAKLNIVDSCFQAAPHKIAIIAQTEGGLLTTLSYQELDKLSNRVANAIVSSGFKPGDALGIFMPMTPLAVAIYLGIIKAGGVVVGIAESFAPDEIKTRLEIAEVKAVFASDYCKRADKRLPLYDKLIKAEAKQVILINQQSMAKREYDIYWQDYIANSTDVFTTFAANPQDYTTILFSSGTTGNPKAIPWSHTTPIKCAGDGYFHHDIKPRDVLAWPTSLGWMMGPWLIYAALLNQATLAIYDGLPTERPFGEFIQKAKVTVLGVVPSLVKSWRASRCMEGLDWHNIKCFSSTGECSNADDMLYLMQLANNKPVIEYCGGTEIGGAYITGTLVQPAIPATFTTPALGLDLVLFDEQDNLSDNGEVGLIGLSMGLSIELLNRDHDKIYFAGMPQLADGQMLRRHGDELSRLPNGYYQALGRADDTMNLGGIKISSVEIERVLNNISGLIETAAIAVKPSEGGPDLLVIYAVPHEKTEVDTVIWRQKMQLVIKNHLNPLFKIHKVILVASLPRTASNKILRRKLRDEYKP